MNPLSAFSSQLQELTIKLRDEKPADVLLASFNLFCQYKVQVSDSERKILHHVIEQITLKNPHLKRVADQVLKEMDKVEEVAQKVISPKITAELVLAKYGNDFNKLASLGTRPEIFCVLEEKKDLPSDFIQILFESVKEGEETLAEKLLPFRPHLSESWLKERPSFQIHANIMRLLVEIEPQAIKKIGEKLKNDASFFLKVINHKNHWIVKYASISLKDNREFLVKLMEITPRAIFEASDRLRDDKELVLNGIKKDPYILMKASKRLKDDAEVILSAIIRDPKTLYDASIRLKNSELIVLNAISQDPRALEYASDQLKDSELIALKAISKDPRTLEFVSLRLKGMESVVLAAIEKNGRSLEFASNELKNNPKVYLKALQKSGCALEFLDAKLRDTKEIVLKAIKNDGRALKYASDALRRDANLICSALVSDCHAIEYVDKKLIEDPTIQATWKLAKYFQQADKSKSDWLNIKDNETIKKLINKVPESIFYEMLKKVPNIKERLYLAAQREALCFIPTKEISINIIFNKKKFEILGSVLKKLSPALYQATQVDPRKVKRFDHLPFLHVNLLKALSNPTKMDKVFSLKAQDSIYRSAFEILGPFVDEVLTDEEKQILANLDKPLTPEQENSFAAQTIDLLIGKKIKK